jgi:hypothetical protein
MITLAGIIVAMAIVVQILDMAGFVFAKDRQHYSSSIAVPIVLCYVALVLRKQGFISYAHLLKMLGSRLGNTWRIV